MTLNDLPKFIEGPGCCLWKIDPGDPVPLASTPYLMAEHVQALITEYDLKLAELEYRQLELEGVIDTLRNKLDLVRARLSD